MTLFEVSYTARHIRVRYSQDGRVLADAYCRLDMQDPLGCVSWAVAWIAERGIAPETAGEAVRCALETPGRVTVVGSGLPLAIAV